MKKIAFVLACILTISICLAGCQETEFDTGEGTPVFSLDANEISAVTFQNGNTGKKTIVSNRDEITEIADYLNAFRYTETQSVRGGDGWSSRIIIDFNEGESISFYSLEAGKIIMDDTEYILTSSEEGKVFDLEYKDSVSEVPDKDDSDAIVPPASVLPFADVVDLSEYFVDEPVEFSESTPKGELVCVNIDESQYSKADDTILLPNEKTKAMAVHCTWASASRTIYIGFIDEVSEEVYTLSAVGGALTGTLDLSSLPEGEYRPIMYSSDNQNINAVMLYQFQ